MCLHYNMTVMRMVNHVFTTVMRMVNHVFTLQHDRDEDG
jgi:hypothetical protein